MRLIVQETSVAATILSLLLISLFALAAATMGSLFSSGLCAIGYDIAPMFWLQPASVLGRPAEQIRAKRSTVIAALGMALATLAAFHLAAAGFDVTLASAKFLCLVFGFSSAPLALSPLTSGTPS